MPTINNLLIVCHVSISLSLSVCVCVCVCVCACVRACVRVCVIRPYRSWRQVLVTYMYTGSSKLQHNIMHKLMTIIDSGSQVIVCVTAK